MCAYPSQSVHLDMRHASPHGNGIVFVRVLPPSTSEYFRLLLDFWSICSTPCPFPSPSWRLTCWEVFEVILWSRAAPEEEEEEEEESRRWGGTGPSPRPSVLYPRTRPLRCHDWPRASTPPPTDKSLDFRFEPGNKCMLWSVCVVCVCVCVVGGRFKQPHLAPGRV